MVVYLQQIATLGIVRMIAGQSMKPELDPVE